MTRPCTEFPTLFFPLLRVNSFFKTNWQEHEGKNVQDIIRSTYLINNLRTHWSNVDHQSVPGFFVQDGASKLLLPQALTNVILAGGCIYYAFHHHHHNLKTILFIDSSKIRTHRYLWGSLGEIWSKNSSTQQRFSYWNNIQIFSVHTTWRRIPYGLFFSI